MFSPEDLELRSALSTAYFNAENYDEALNHALCVVELDEKDPQAYCNLGSCYSAQNMIDEAVKAFQKASEIDPDYSLPHTNLGSLYATVGRLEKAIKEFKLATSMNKGDALGWLNLYNCYKEVGRSGRCAGSLLKNIESLNASGVSRPRSKAIFREVFPLRPTCFRRQPRKRRCWPGRTELLIPIGMRNLSYELSSPASTSRRF